jgi:hypothetical protein
LVVDLIDFCKYSEFEDDLGFETISLDIAWKLLDLLSSLLLSWSGISWDEFVFLISTLSLLEFCFPKELLNEFFKSLLELNPISFW